MNWKRPIKLTLSILFLALLASQIDFGELVNTLRSANPVYILIALPLPFLGHVLISASWAYMLDRSWWDEKKDFFEFLQSLIAVNSFIPLKLGRASAPLLLRETTSLEDLDKGLSVSIFATMSYSVLYGLVTLIGALLLIGRVDFYLILLALLSSAIYLAMAIGLLNLGFKFRIPYSTKFESVFDRVLPRNFMPDGGAVSSDFRRLVRLNYFSVYSISWLSTNILIKFARVYILFLALGYLFPEPFYLFFLPVVTYSVSVLPISFGGIGLVEFSSYLFYSAFGVPEGIVASAVLLDRFIGYYIPSLIGGGFLIKSQNEIVRLQG